MTPVADQFELRWSLDSWFEIRNFYSILIQSGNHRTPRQKDMCAFRAVKAHILVWYVFNENVNMQKLAIRFHRATIFQLDILHTTQTIEYMF